MDRSVTAAAVCSLVTFAAGAGVGFWLGSTTGGRGTCAQAVPVPLVDPPAYNVRRVIDGDTFTIDYRDEGETKVRLLGVDTPERGEPGFDEATLALRHLIGDRPVQLHYDAEKRRDNFGRLLARVTVEGVDVSQQMLKQGHGKPWTGTMRPAR